MQRVIFQAKPILLELLLDYISSEDFCIKLSVDSLGLLGHTYSCRGKNRYVGRSRIISFVGSMSNNINLLEYSANIILSF